MALAAASTSSPTGSGLPPLPGGIPGLGPGPHLQLPGPPGMPGGAGGLPPGMVNYTSVLSSLASQYAPGVKDEAGSLLSKENASSPRGSNIDLASLGKTSSNRSSTNGKSSKHHRPSSGGGHGSKSSKISTAESDGERSETDLVIDTSVGGLQKSSNGSGHHGSGLLLPNGVKSESADNNMGLSGMMGSESLNSASNGGGGSSRHRMDQSPMSDKDGSHRVNSSSGVKKERNTPQPNKAMTPIAGLPGNMNVPSMPPSAAALGLPPGLAGRLPPSGPFGYDFSRSEDN